MKRASYRAAIEWIATEDDPAGEADAETLAGTLTVCLVADLFGVERERVARDVVRHRARQPSSS